MREIRFSIDRDWAAAAHGIEGFGAAHPISNSWGGWPSAVGISPYFVLRAGVEGPPDPVTGYLVNIQHIDVLLRERAIPLIAQRLAEHGVRTTGEYLVRDIWSATIDHVPAPATLVGLELHTTPYLRYGVEGGNPDMVLLTQTFEFSASHRLHVDRLSPDENRKTFGKCNNPNGHGHNYGVEVRVSGQPDKVSGCVLPLPAFEDTVKREVIDKLDHKHLNSDVPEFAKINPSVENIAMVIWSMLAGKVAPAKLDTIRVWETGKTYAEYRGE